MVGMLKFVGFYMVGYFENFNMCINFVRLVGKIIYCLVY